MSGAPSPRAATLAPVTASAGGVTRILRAAVATLVIIGVGATAHEMGGGAPLRLIPAVVLAVLVGPMVWVCVRRKTTLPRMLSATALGQVVTHLALAGMVPTPGASASGVHLHDAMAPMPLMPPSMAPSLSLTSSMLLAHALATLIASVLLTAGVDVIRAVVRHVTVRDRLPRVAVAVPQGAPIHVLVRVLDGRVVGPIGGRAPPLALV
jgi:hypothetical protein